MNIDITKAIERRRDPRMNNNYSLENWLRWSSYRLGAEAMVIVDSWGRVLVEHGAGTTTEDLALLPGDDPLYYPSRVQEALFDSQDYIDRIHEKSSTKVWPFRFAQGIGYLVCVLQRKNEILHVELENVCAGFRRIFGEEYLKNVA